MLYLRDFFKVFYHDALLFHSYALYEITSNTCLISNQKGKKSVLGPGQTPTVSACKGMFTKRAAGPLS